MHGGIAVAAQAAHLMTNKPLLSDYDEESARRAFEALVESPLCADLLRALWAQPNPCDVAQLIQQVGRMRHDVEACLTKIAALGLARRWNGVADHYEAVRPAPAALEAPLAAFLETARPPSREDHATVQHFRRFVGRDEKMVFVLESVRTAARIHLPVLLLGPTGAGKELVARMIHELGPRHAARFQAVNCAALPDSLFESEVFGYERGAFTGAEDRKAGRVELADGGTLFLDEIADLSPIAQAKLLRVLEERRVERLGGRTSIPVDFRLISATNRPLDTYVEDGRFRDDLYYRINAFVIRLPALCERRADIPILAERFLATYCAAQGLPADALRFSPAALRELVAYRWPGNVRQLETTVARAAHAVKSGWIEPRDLQFLDGSTAAPRLPSSLRDAERLHIARILDEVRWNKRQAARILEISRETLYRKIAEYNLKPIVTADARADAEQESVRAAAS